MELKFYKYRMYVADYCCSPYYLVRREENGSLSASIEIPYSLIMPALDNNEYGPTDWPRIKGRINEKSALDFKMVDIDHEAPDSNYFPIKDKDIIALIESKDNGIVYPSTERDNSLGAQIKYFCESFNTKYDWANSTEKDENGIASFPTRIYSRYSTKEIARSASYWTQEKFNLWGRK